ncbi:hypothetical protein ALC53_02862 [Atta colombica]|uniref:Uncharacterized protein n=1 Tax=Atta colombica TaxID=520822 RepID=A0A195BQZ1_9HYME|nr:hypothetical protein ALC53_02862 [Atta colombica]
MERCHFYGHRKLPRGRDTLSDIIGNSTCTSAKHCDAQIPSLQKTFGGRRTKSLRSFISREKPEVERCE